MAYISTGSEWTFELIQRYEHEIARIAKDFRLDTYPNQIEIITGELGWVVQDFLSAGDPPPSGGVSVGDTIKVVDGPLNIRSGAGTGYSVVDVAATGAVATVTAGPTSANGYTWVKIHGNLLVDGWVAFDFCKVV